MREGNDYRNVDQVPRLAGCPYEIVSELENLFPGRRFTPDGHLVGSPGEVAVMRVPERDRLPTGNAV
jgi:hypothetical protein